ncbi:3-methyladenine DNA glycosylase [Pseudonocardia sp. WMMC193]|uniref:3-methyladenine DNA glycosylase n=1 Tax=Pseudonocardia sp. WMMC193 TaxID=2911965 RepID=UPI001F4227D4|nr:3-methyladenine DNA glycosylase [Pseudonocardia sp. WMMC193]MCF7548857.1 3-methyladenine DNA glycosylase [Pseudonocardia sp. WMMC193]
MSPVPELSETEWRARAAAHRARMERWTVPYRARRQRGEAHPVEDFLFTYYSLRPQHLEQWQPGPGVRAVGFARAGYRDGMLDGVSDRVRRTAGFVHGLVGATAARPGRYGCFGLHEWAMVYRTADPRHPVPLRLGAAGTDAVVESLPVTCTHHDAFRFFTAAARPLNTLQPRREDQAALEQPGCLHATMDLYKWAYKLLPATPAELLGDCFALAAEVRELDMRASPYDLRAHGYAPVRIETAEGRAEYAAAQRGFADRAAPLRTRLLALCSTLTGAPADSPANGALAHS